MNLFENTKTAVMVRYAEHYGLEMSRGSMICIASRYCAIICILESARRCNTCQKTLEDTINDFFVKICQMFDYIEYLADF